MIKVGDIYKMKIKFLKASYGDSILISFLDDESKNRNILIDGGTTDTYKLDKGPKGKPVNGDLYSVVDDIRTKGESIDLLIITHVDNDHLCGIIKWFSEDSDAHKLFKEIWFNTGKDIAKFLKEAENNELKFYIKNDKSLNTSISKGIELTEYIEKNKIRLPGLIKQGYKLDRFGIKFQIISPSEEKLKRLLKEWKKEEPDLNTSGRRKDYEKTLSSLIEGDFFEEDNSVANGSSIAFIMSYKEKNYLFLGDAHPSVVIEGIKNLGYTESKKLKVDFVKVSHHGSSKNTNNELLDLIDSEKFIISTDGKNFGHPDKKMLARLINKKPNCSVFFNYEEQITKIFLEEDRKEYPIFKTYSTDELGVKL